MAYATVDELAAELHIRAIPENEPKMEACLDAAAVEIDHDVDRPVDDPIPADDPLANRVNLLRAVEWHKAQDAAFGVIGTGPMGDLQAPRDGFNRHAYYSHPAQAEMGHCLSANGMLLPGRGEGCRPQLLLPRSTPMTPTCTLMLWIRSPRRQSCWSGVIPG